MVVTKHELLKITDKLIFSSDYIQQIHILIIKYTFSSKLFSSTAYINMQTQVVKNHFTTKYKTVTSEKQK